MRVCSFSAVPLKSDNTLARRLGVKKTKRCQSPSPKPRQHHMFASYEIGTSCPSLTAIKRYDLDKSADVLLMDHKPCTTRSWKTQTDKTNRRIKTRTKTKQDWLKDQFTLNLEMESRSLHLNANCSWQDKIEFFKYITLYQQWSGQAHLFICVLIHILSLFDISSKKINFQPSFQCKLHMAWQNRIL